MPRRRLTKAEFDAHITRNRWLTRTRGKALQQLKEMYPREFQRLLNQERDNNPCPTNEVTDEASSAS